MNPSFDPYKNDRIYIIYRKFRQHNILQCYEPTAVIHFRKYFQISDHKVIQTFFCCMTNDRLFFSHLHKINRCHALMIRNRKEKMIRDQKFRILNVRK